MKTLSFILLSLKKTIFIAKYKDLIFFYESVFINLANLEEKGRHVSDDQKLDLLNIKLD